MLTGCAARGWRTTHIRHVWGYRKISLTTRRAFEQGEFSLPPLEIFTRVRTAPPASVGTDGTATLRDVRGSSLPLGHLHSFARVLSETHSRCWT